MTPADRKIWKGNFITLGIGLLIMVGTFAIDKNYLEDRELLKKIDGKADKKQVLEWIREHEVKEDLKIAPIKEEVKNLQDADLQIRREFLEQIKMLRTDLNLKKNRD